MTRRSLERIAVGATMNFAGSDLFQISRPDAQGGEIRAIYCREDEETDSLIAIMSWTAA